MRELYSRCVRVAEIAPTPMSAPPPSPQNAITLIGSAFILPFRMSALRPAAVPSAAQPEDPSFVGIPGPTPGAGYNAGLAPYTPPAEPRPDLARPGASTLASMTKASS